VFQHASLPTGTSFVPSLTLNPLPFSFLPAPFSLPSLFLTCFPTLRKKVVADGSRNAGHKAGQVIQAIVPLFTAWEAGPILSPPPPPMTCRPPFHLVFLTSMPTFSGFFIFYNGYSDEAFDEVVSETCPKTTAYFSSLFCSKKFSPRNVFEDSFLFSIFFSFLTSFRSFLLHLLSPLSLPGRVPR